MENLDSKIRYYGLPVDEKKNHLIAEYKLLLNKAKVFGVDYKVMSIYMDSVNKYKSNIIKDNINGKLIKIDESDAIEFAIKEIEKELPKLIKEKQEARYTISSEEVWKIELAQGRIIEDSRKKQLEFPLNLPRSFKLEHLIQINNI